MSVTKADVKRMLEFDYNQISQHIRQEVQTDWLKALEDHRKLRPRWLRNNSCVGNRAYNRCSYCEVRAECSSRDEAWKITKLQCKLDWKPNSAQQSEKEFSISDGKGNECFPLTDWFKNAVVYQGWTLELLERQRTKQQASIKAAEKADRQKKARQKTMLKKATEVAAAFSSSAEVRADEPEPKLAAGTKRLRVDSDGTKTGKPASPALPLVPPRCLAGLGIPGASSDDLLRENDISGPRYANPSIQPLAATSPATASNEGDEGNNIFFGKRKKYYKKNKKFKTPKCGSNVNGFDALDSSSSDTSSPSADSPARWVYQVTLVNAKPGEDPRVFYKPKGKWVKASLRGEDKRDRKPLIQVSEL